MAKRIEREVRLGHRQCLRYASQRCQRGRRGDKRAVAQARHRMRKICSTRLLRSAKHDVANATGIPAEELHAIRRGDSREDRVRGDRRRTECAMLHETTCSEACRPVRTERAQRRGARSREEPCSGRNLAFAAYSQREKK